ncbi:undecaprenyl-diphosphate phosphatase [Fenollaria sporofastidiosus]|uniref:undecaprenyl-diphosphate phosphatase n=1 Tax=Fenollaria sporofastidiosus TaxID=2811778 RepID=UPI001C0071D1|nr:undecaprenyl-diphosphate phosphatase [Fenollaria sporofastidiosus]
MTLLKAIILAIVQGITEFLPISSSGHLAILQILFNIKEGNVFFSQVLHFGTLLSILLVYHKQVINMIKEFFKMIASLIRKEKITLNHYQKLALYIIIATIPTVIIALFIEKFLDQLYMSALLIGICFLITAVLIYIIDINMRSTKKISEAGVPTVLAIGAVQGIAALPGISRSGSTIFISHVLGVRKKDAVDFSFLLAIPAMFGGFILGLKDIYKEGASVSFDTNAIVGLIISFITGVLAIRLIKLLAKNKKFHVFSYYLVVLGIVCIIASFL